MQNLKVQGRTILLDDEGQPIQVGIVMRQSASAPARIKACLVTPTHDDEGNEGIVPLPFAVPIMGSRKPRGFTPEFRLEMN
jgi:hypothetical protein